MTSHDTLDRLSGRVVCPGGTGWDEARRGFAARADYDGNLPQAIVFCRDAQDAANAVNWARANGVSVRARGGRHHYEGQSSLVRGGIIVDVSEIDFVRVAPDGASVTVGAGARMLALSDALGQFGAAIPLATGSGVGIAGLTLGGGFGMTSRKWGLTCDSLLGLDMALADGRIATVDETQNADLFWACRGGGGGNFGVAVSFTFQIHPAPRVALLSARYPWEQFDAVVARFQRWIDAADNGVTAFLTLLSTRNIVMQGQFTPNPGDDEDALEKSADDALAPMIVADLLPMASGIQIMPHSQAARVIMEVDPVTPQTGIDGGQLFKSTSAFAYDFLPPAAIDRLRRGLEAVPSLAAPTDQPSMVQLLGGGGQIARIDPYATAAYHRQARLLVQYNAYWSAPQDSGPTLAWINSLRREMAEYTHGAYVNYIDSDLDHPLEQYYGANLPRLREIKRRYNPDNLFAQLPDLSVTA